MVRVKPTDEALRAAAIKAIAKVSCADKTCCCPQTFTVPDHGTIHRTERFAFVEAVIAVPLREDGSIAE